MNRLLAGFIGLCLSTPPALAQQVSTPPASDEQLQQLMIRTLRAELDLANAVSSRREAEWAQYSKSLWQMPEPSNPKAAK